MLWEPQRKWEGQDAFLIGGGASLRSFDFNLLKGRNTIGCNDAFRLGREICQHCIFGDASWWHRAKFDLQKYGDVFTVAPSLLRFNCKGLIQLIRQRSGLHCGHEVGWNFSTGATAINLAANMGAKRIFLLGYDLRLDEKGKSHWHAHRKAPTTQIVFGRFIKGFQQVANAAPKFGIEVIHVIDGHSSLPFFMQMPFREFYHVLSRTRRCRSCGELSGGEWCLECSGEMIKDPEEEVAV